MKRSDENTLEFRNSRDRILNCLSYPEPTVTQNNGTGTNCALSFAF